MWVAMILLSSGFSLIELLVVMLILSILALLVVPSYLEYIRRSHRLDATSTLMSIQLAQEQYRMNNTIPDKLGNASFITSESYH